MSSHRDSALDVAIVGGGIIGLSVAWRAAQRGLSVAVLERDGLGSHPPSGATHVAAGMLAPVSEVEFGEAGRGVLELGMRSAAMWPDFAAELERAGESEVGLRRAGTLVVARDDDEARELERQLAFRRELGLRALRLRASEAREREPALAPTVRLALLAPDDHSVDPRRAIAALWRACEREGVRLHRHTAVLGVELDAARERVCGVRVASGGDGAPGGADELAVGAVARGTGGGGAGVRSPAAGERGGGAGGVEGEVIPAREVVVACGAWSGMLAGLPDGAGVSVRPVKGQILRLRDPAGPGLLAGVVRFHGGYLVPRGDGGYVLGATVEERGFEPNPTAGGVYELLRDAHELVPGIGELHIEELSVGYRPGTPDNAPIVGRGQLDGLLWATGHHRNGILLAPLTAELVVGELTLTGGDSGRADMTGGERA
jgi:glycine oxidase